MKRFMYWLPRILAILFVAFVSIFAFDVFSEPNWFWAFLIHLIPSFVLIIMTVVAWKYEQVGGVLFFIAGLIFLVSVGLESAIISLPAMITGILFFVDKYIQQPQTQ